MIASSTKRNLFLSHNSRDKEQVRPLAAALQVAGAHVWFDEWVLKPGDSVPSMISQGLGQFDTFVIVWSKNAAESRWVATEMEGALIRQVSGETSKIVPVILDSTPLPHILSHLYYIDHRTQSHVEVAKRLLGIDTDRELRIAVQSFLDEARLDFQEFWGVGVLVGCPKCGAGLDRIRGFDSIDEMRDDRYRGAQCLDCGWSDASEV